MSQGKTATDIKTGKRGRAIVRGGEGTATRTVGLLGGIFAYAVDCGMIDISPVLGVKRFADKKGNRYLSQQEFVALGAAPREAEAGGENPAALAILKLLIFTGARKGEIEALTWPEVDFEVGYLRLADSKTGQKAIPLNTGALQVLNDQRRLKVSDHVFPAHRGWPLSGNTQGLEARPINSGSSGRPASRSPTQLCKHCCLGRGEPADHRGSVGPHK